MSRIFLFWSSILLLAGGSGGCHAQPTLTVPLVSPSVERQDIRLIPFDATTQQITFQSRDGVQLAGQFDLPPGLTSPPLVFIIHHSGAVDRDSYQYLAARLVPAGYAVFRFDKRGTGTSQGEYGCCEDDDALAAYRAAMTGANGRVYIVAQSIGTKILADRWKEFEQTRHPDGVVLLSNLLEGQEIAVLNAPIHIIISSSESRIKAIGEEAVIAHRVAYPKYNASFQVIPNTEHTLFDISSGQIDWSDPNWTLRFHPEAWQSLKNWLDGQH